MNTSIDSTHEEPKPPRGPVHSFWLLDRKERQYCEYSDLLAREDAPVRIPDDILRYFHDVLQWISTFNPARKEESNGLLYFGPTIITGDGARLWSKVCRDIATLFRNGPETLILTCDWEFLLDDNGERLGGNYARFVVDRDWLTSVFALMASWGEESIDGSKYILHLGV